MANSGEVWSQPAAPTRKGLMCGSMPGQGTRTGVRTSANPRARKKARMPSSTRSRVARARRRRGSRSHRPGTPRVIPTPVRLAHVTDVHLLSLDGTRLRDFLNKRWAGGLNILLNRGRHHLAEVFDALVDDLNRLGVDQVAFTGDVTNLSLASEFRFARAHFDRIAVGPTNAFCVPGNHDNYVAEVAGRFEETFAPYCAADPGWEWPDGARWPSVRVRGDLALVGLTTSQPSGLLMGHGTVGAEQLARLEKVLGDPRLADKLRVVVMHHPSAGRHARSKRRGLRDHEAFAEVIGRAGAELVLHGHEHLDLRNALDGPDGPVPVHGVQSGSYAIDSERRRARYRVYTIEPAAPRPRLGGIETRTWRPARAGFELEAVI
jgi:3',5'-cyclic AMP phosphodiesterase CpdA